MSPFSGLTCGHFKRKHIVLSIILTLIFLMMWCGFFLSRDAKQRYEKLTSVVQYDRHHTPIRIKPNNNGHYALTQDTLPDTFISLLLQKEDQLFYYHVGLNPYSIVRAFYRYVIGEKTGGSSTLTEQLAKNLLQNENHRSIKNKLIELAYAFSMELFFGKDTILSMYGNTVYLGNQIQGFEMASHAYYNKNLSETTMHERIALLATLSYPTTRNPWGNDNEVYARALYTHIVATGTYVPPVILKQFSLQDTSRFELESLGVECTTSCTTTLDISLNDHIRSILKRIILKEYDRGVRNGAVVVINPHTEEILALVGSPDPLKDTHGGKINMAIQPRPIGSTVKPFIYLDGFMNGLRPYTHVDDREYKYPIATGYSLYPKNYDGVYHGEITLHEALSNSLNVPSVKILEFITLPKFYSFLQNTLQFKPIQPLDSYQYGIALGGLEMDLLTLTHYFTIFPREGTLAPLTVLLDTHTPYIAPQSHITGAVTVSDPQYTELVTAILSDRLTGVGQFGLTSSLNVSNPEYAVKTGTSRDFHDSWVVGYTPDYVVGVWLGNSENEALAQVSGQSGAGAVWHDVMEYLHASSYTTKSQFKNEHLTTFLIGNSREWGLLGDTVTDHASLLMRNTLITSIHEQDTFQYAEHTHIPLRAREAVTWRVNGIDIGTGTDVTFTPTHAGTFEIEARTQNREREIITITVTAPQ